MGDFDVPQIIRSNLRSIRELRELTQVQLGELAGLGAASISHFETGHRTPSVETLVRLADALQVSTDFLLGRADMEASPRLDPVFLQASRADSQTLDTLKRITQALLERNEGKETGKQK